MRVKVSYCQNSYNSFFASIIVPMVSTKNLFVGRSGVLCEKETLKICTPKSYVLNFIRFTNKLLNKNTVLKIIEEQLKNGSKPGINRLEIRSSVVQSEYERLNTVYVCAKDIDLDDSRVSELIGKYVQEM